MKSHHLHFYLVIHLNFLSSSFPPIMPTISDRRSIFLLGPQVAELRIERRIEGKEQLIGSLIPRICKWLSS